jgi:hypothetical protein
MGRPGAPAGLADKPTLRRVVIGAILVGTVLLLLSMGGEILAAPVVLPLLWWAARTTGRGVRVLGAILAALVVGEVAWAGVYLVVGERQPYIWALPALSVAVTVWLMLVHQTRPARARVGSTPRRVTAATAQPSRRLASQQTRSSRPTSAKMTTRTGSASFSRLLVLPP